MSEPNYGTSYYGSQWGPTNLPGYDILQNIFLCVQQSF